MITAFTVASSNRSSVSGIWPWASSSSSDPLGDCPCSATGSIPAHCSASTLPAAILAKSSEGCLLRKVTKVWESPGAAGGETRALAALVMPLRSRASLLALSCRASGVSSRAFCRLSSRKTTSQSVRPASSPQAYSLCRPWRLQRPSDDCRRAGVIWRSLVALSRSL